jgi:hypothetical protein
MGHFVMTLISAIGKILLYNTGDMWVGMEQFGKILISAIGNSLLYSVGDT